jgi:cell division protein ZapA
MNGDTIPVTIRIMDKEFRVACTEDERDALLESARYLDRQMKEIRDSRKVIGADRIAMMAALNIAHELLQAKSQKGNYSESISARIQQLQDKIEGALYKNNQLEL